MNNTVRKSLVGVLLLSSCFLLGSSGCAATDKSGESSSSGDGAAFAATSTALRVPLTSENIYTYLAFNRALKRNNILALIDPLRELSKYSPPVSVYIEAGIWAMENSAKALVPLIKEGLKLHGHDTSLNLLYAELLQKYEGSEKAVEHITEYLQAYPNAVDAQVELALLHSNNNELDKAEKIFLSIAEKDRSGIVDYYHAKTLVKLGRKAEALTFLESAVKKTPDFLEGLNDLAFLYEQNKDYRKARDTYIKMLDSYSASYELILRVIMLSLRLNEIDTAVKFFEDNPLTPEITVTVASLFVESGNYDVAEPILHGLADLEDAPQELYLYLAAIAYERDASPQKAYDWLSHIDEKDAAYERSLYLRLQLLLDLEKYDLALKEVQKSIQKKPNDPEFWLLEIRILASMKNFSKGIEKAVALMQKWPDNMEIAYVHASLLDQSGQKNAALEAMEAIIKKQPDYFQALNYVGYTLAEQSKDLKRAVRLLRQADALSPDSNYILDSLAWALYKIGETKEAWKVINKAVQAEGAPEPTIWEHYGDIARTLGKKEEARKGYKKALEFTPSNADTITYKLQQL